MKRMIDPHKLGNELATMNEEMATKSTIYQHTIYLETGEESGYYIYATSTVGTPASDIDGVVGLCNCLSISYLKALNDSDQIILYMGNVAPEDSDIYIQVIDTLGSEDTPELKLQYLGFDVNDIVSISDEVSSL